MGRRQRSLFGLLVIGSLISGATAADPPAAYRRPELVAITWQNAGSGVQDVQQAWRPDGSMLDSEEKAWLQRELGSFNFNPVDDTRNHPLILIFRIDERAKASQLLVTHYRKDGKSEISGSSDYSGKNFLARCSLAPRKILMAEWGPEVDFEVRVPVEEMEVIKKVDSIQAGEIHVDKGVRWYQGLWGDSRQPTAVLEIKRTDAGTLSDYFVDIRLKNGDPLRERFRQLRGDLPLPDEVKVSHTIPEKNPIAGLEFRRLRHRMERYEKIPTHLELKPKAK